MKLLCSKPKVGLYFHHLSGAGGGAERAICFLANALFERGFVVHLFSLDGASQESFYPLNREIHWHRLGFHLGMVDKFRRTRTLARLLCDHTIPVLVGFVMSGDKTVYTAVKLAGVRLVVAERNAPSMYRMRYTPVQRWMSFGFLHLADRITVQFPEFAKEYPVRLRDRIEIIPNAVPVALQTAQPNRPAQNGRFTLLAVSRIDVVQKRLDCLIRAFARIATDHSTWDLRIIGDGPSKVELAQQVVELGLSERVRLDDSIHDIFDVYSRSHLFVIPSLWEGFPNALAEALSHGVPAVGFKGAAGVCHLIQDGETGWLAKGVDNVTTLAETLDQAMADNQERMHRGVLAIKRMAAYASEVPVDRWVRLLDSLI